jgi:hypothetical protein
MVPVATSSWTTLASGQTVTFAPDAASCAATPMHTAEAAPAGATVPVAEAASTCPPVTVADVVNVTG